MAKWLESGTRRDVCAILYAGGELRAPQLKRRLEAHYDARIDPKRFYGRLDALVESGHVERRVDGLDDIYALTDAGARAIRDHYAWLRELIEGQE
ncbi:PadR family transcriptional regulator [Halomarina halobia]|uniref:PadR family transcriptional regulator n=1 Tax=Halomarina halobia TaxID=3033386 RepID=A0ABD6ACR2_9EURY|nr:PadR family transcriptional regulator [Halomarina sp. PSR21]